MIKKLAFVAPVLAAVSSFADGTTAVVDLSGLQTTATTQLGSVGTILVAIGGTTVAIVAVIAGVKFVKRILG